MPKTSSLLKAKEIYRDYGTGNDRVRALAPLSLQIEPDEFILVRGPSGSGKSTLLAILAGLEVPSGGEIFFQGRLLHGLSPSEIARIRNRHFGFVFQTPHMQPDRTVLENVALPGRYNPILRRGEVLDRAHQCLDAVGLSALSGRRPQTLSGGEAQRVALARALFSEPALIFADEPTGHLDASNSRIILDLLSRQCREGRAVVMVTHDEQALSSGSREILLDKFKQPSPTHDHDPSSA